MAPLAERKLLAGGSRYCAQSAKLKWETWKVPTLALCGIHPEAPQWPGMDLLYFAVSS